MSEAEVSQRTSGGVPLTKELIAELAQEAERGYDLDRLWARVVPPSARPTPDPAEADPGVPGD